MNRNLLLLPALALLAAPQTAQSAADFWELDGNALNAGEFLGSTNAIDVVFKANNVERMRIRSNGNVQVTAEVLDVFSNMIVHEDLSVTFDLFVQDDLDVFGNAIFRDDVALFPDPGNSGDLILPLGSWNGFRPLGDPPQGDLTLNRGNVFLLAEGTSPANLSLSDGDLIVPHGIWRGRDGFVGDGNLSLYLGDLLVQEGDVGIGLKAGEDSFLSASYDVLLTKNHIRIGDLRDPVFPPSNHAVLHIEAVGRYPGIGQEGHHAVFIKSHAKAGDSSFTPDGIAIQLDATPGNSVTDDKNNYLTFYDNLGVPIGAIEANPSPGNPPVDVGVRFKSGAADFAEYLEKEDPADTFEMGEIVGVSAGRISRVTQGADHILIVTRAPVVLGNAPQLGFEDLWESVAFLGQVPTLVRGDVTPGDYILPSGFEDGTGIAVSREDLQPADLPRIVGTAWSGLVGDPGGGPGLVTVAIGFKAINWGAIIDDEVDDLKKRVRQLEEMIEKITGRVRQPPSWDSQP